MSCREPIHQMPLDLSGSLSFTLLCGQLEDQACPAAPPATLSSAMVCPAFPSKPSLIAILLVALFPVLPVSFFVWPVAAVVALPSYYFPLQPFTFVARVGVLLSTTHHLFPQLSVRVWCSAPGSPSFITFVLCRESLLLTLLPSQSPLYVCLSFFLILLFLPLFFIQFPSSCLSFCSLFSVIACLSTSSSKLIFLTAAVTLFDGHDLDTNFPLITAHSIRCFSPP